MTTDSLPKKTSVSVSLAALVLVIAQGCGPNTNGDPQMVCSSMPDEDELQQCVVEDFNGDDLWGPEDFEPLCDSRCDTINGILVDGGGIQTLKPLSNIREVRAAFVIDRARDLGTLEGVENIEGIGTVNPARFEILSAALLENTSGFDSLEEVWGDEFWIYDNYALRDVTGFPKLTRINARLHISGNPELRRISGFQNLTHVDGDVVISDNPQLPRCEAEKLVERIDTITGDVTIENNGTGNCN